jgi:hypothetical protein
MWQPLSAANTDTSALGVAHVNSAPLPTCDLGLYPQMFRDFTSRGCGALHAFLTSKFPKWNSPLSQYLRALSQRTSTLNDTHLWVFKPPSFTFCQKKIPLQECVITPSNAGLVLVVKYPP